MAYRIDAARCNGCGVCLKSCPIGAVSGEKRKLHTIDARLCVECAVCGMICPEEAVQDPDGQYVAKVARAQRPRPVAEPWACTGCGVCVDRCPVEALTMAVPPPPYGPLPAPYVASPPYGAPPPAGLVARVDLKQCVGCAICAEDCPYGAIVMKPLVEAKEALEGSNPGADVARRHTGQPDWTQ